MTSPKENRKQKTPEGDENAKAKTVITGWANRKQKTPEGDENGFHFFHRFFSFS